MSAWLVTDNHIRLLVQALKLYGSEPVEDADALCYDLYRENARSVNYRYSERNRFRKIEYRPVITAEDSGDIRGLILKSIDCYRYQTCEHPGWRTSEVERITRELEETILATYPQPLKMAEGWAGDPPYVDKDYLPGYKAAPWGFE